MKRADRYCSLLFDKMSVCQGFHYERAKQYISGYEDMGSLGRTNKAANHALVFMIRRLRLQWKQVIAYYFTANTVSANNLKFLIEEIISQLQNIGLTVVATVCDQGTTNVSALNQLCAKQHPRQGLQMIPLFLGKKKMYKWHSMNKQYLLTPQNLVIFQKKTHKL
ncbi:hypothetical protein TcasGA2_TC001484 [Tribolium castaneum]|uniref:Transposable element P transposase-like RNase H domain-containing protein n=1 Tax=Tribolium castaneum TaxID=7070 RepID=D7GY80_TRICA|nr:hypothetical protein TcasGA2_TC001484 [Tribolium castaneum]